ncbi:MAG: hypothetical protein ACTSRE_11245 [Promethearchaeota archaeon]
MNKKHIAYIVLGMVLLGTIATLSISMVSAQGDVDVHSNMYQTQQQAGEQYTYRFHEHTRLRIQSQNTVNLDMDCDAMNIGDRTFDIELESDGEATLTMTCRRETIQLGVQAGALIRNQNRHQIREGFAIEMECEEMTKARIGMEMTRGEAIRASWAYFDEDIGKWVEVESSYQDGMLVAETDHFSVWTIVDGGSLVLLWVGIGVGVVALGAIAAVLIKRKRA